MISSKAPLGVPPKNSRRCLEAVLFWAEFGKEKTALFFSAGMRQMQRSRRQPRGSGPHLPEVNSGPSPLASLRSSAFSASPEVMQRSRRQPRGVAPLRSLAITAFVAAALTGCLSTRLSNEWSDPNLSWDTLKRDQIVMTPLIDLRPDATRANDERGAFFDEKRRIQYAEDFKQAFFKLRKDIRIFGAGGAFEHVTKVPKLDSVVQQILAKQPLPVDTVRLIEGGTQQIRFLMAFAVTKESVRRSFTRSSPDGQPYDTKVYSSERDMTVQMALWDSSQNKVVWVGTQRVSPTETRTIRVPRRGVILDRRKAGNLIDAWDDPNEISTLESELSRRADRFPQIPGREPAFSGSFKDFALGFPIDPSEQRLLEYENFVFHRLELGVRRSGSGGAGLNSLRLGVSSIIYDHYRLGLILAGSSQSRKRNFDGNDWLIGEAQLSPTFDFEFELSRSIRVLFGVQTGLGVLEAKRVREKGAVPAEDDPEKDKIGGMSFIAWPRAQILFGDRSGFQWGPSVLYRRYTNRGEPIFREYTNSPWAGELAVALTSRGF